MYSNVNAESSGRENKKQIIWIIRVKKNGRNNKRPCSTLRLIRKMQTKK